MHRAMESARSADANLLRPLHLGHIGASYRLLRQPNIGLDLLDQAIQTVEQTSERVFEAELYRLRGDLLLSLGNERDAEVNLERALAVARGQQARLWELRAAASLARLFRDQGQRRHACDLLAPIYGWFTEGFDTPDLKQAKVLLDELT